uniref:Uncharacterized protein n=1 Tax=viral metagenome TaxID=1070528 RepID=A0A6C0IIR1_9ZZZZ
MDFLTNWFQNINAKAESANNKQSNNKQSDCKPINYKESHYNQNKYKTCMLDQGKKLNNNQYKRAEALSSNVGVMNAPFGLYEGFISSNMTNSKNGSQLSDTTTLSDDFNKNIKRYETEEPIFIDETRNFMKLNDRNKNIKDEANLYKYGDNNSNEITYVKEGCYKSAGASGLEYQSDMTDVSVNTCKMKASDLGYSGFAIRKGAGGQLGCYLTKNIEGGKSGGIATKPVTSFAFQKSTTANKGGLLPNGQVGIYNNNVDTELVTDLTARAGCELKGGNVLINDKTLVASWGSNCK